MSPFAGYPDFDACVADHQDANDPGALCAWLEHKTTGKWPGEMTMGLPAPVQEKFWQTFDAQMEQDKDEAKAMQVAVSLAAESGWVKKPHGWMKRADHKMATHSVLGVPIFATGVHNGDQYSAEDLQDMVEAFKALKGRLDPPLKVGHTSDEFNKSLARKMGIDPALVEGESGNGVMAFGWMDNVRIEGNVLYADLTDVPKPIVDLIESKSYSKLSAEVLFNYDDNGTVYPKVICGLALLGAELPAVKEAGLETAAVYVNNRKPTVMVEYVAEEAVFADYPWDQCMRDQMDRYGDEETARKVCGAIRAKSKGLSKHEIPWLLTAVESELQIEPKKEGVMAKEFLKLLGLDEKATDDQMSAAVKRLQDAAKAAQAPPGPPADQLGPVKAALGLPPEATAADCIAKIKEMAGAMASMQANKTDVQKFADRISNLETENKSLKRVQRVAFYRQAADKMGAISGKPEEIADELVKLEEAAGEATAKVVLNRYQADNQALVAAGVLKAKGTPAEGDGSDDHQFMKDMRAYMAEKNVDEPTAQAEMRKQKPVLFKEYMASRRVR